ncbi:hypothetical protein CVT25_009589 [Psilocybe cyanescens]|uniref:Uncharacterized protein n=1 Tax=Psilocybe cyanescens TaxID=93625 RepID=A0A409XDK4_PSICY|nr:hypothetical protein CVT25_009589 [Psilocybe cyanescens]
MPQSLANFNEPTKAERIIDSSVPMEDGLDEVESDFVIPECLDGGESSGQLFQQLKDPLAQPMMFMDCISQKPTLRLSLIPTVPNPM